MSTYSIAPGTKKNLFISMAAGVVLILLGYLFTGDGSAKPTGHGEEHGTHTEATATHEEALEATPAAETAAAPAVDSNAALVTSAPMEKAYVYEDVSAAFAKEHKDHEAQFIPTSAGVTKYKKLLISFYSAAVFLFFIALTAMFVLSGATIAYGGWHIQIQKLILSISATFLLSIPLMILLWAVSGHDLFHWMHEELFIPGSIHFDEILASKGDYLNASGFWIRAAILISTISIITIAWWRTQNRMDTHPSIAGLSSMRVIAAISIVIIAMGIDTFATWDWIMSIQPHWYSTLYPWYVFASAAVTMFSFLQLYLIFMKSHGYLPNVNENHIHDVGKLMFAISVFWTYLFFSQYMLIWYANIPEETIYFKKRLLGYPFLFWLAFFLNFVLPFFVLLKRDAKRNKKVVITAAFLIIIGHFIDFFLMVAPEIAPIGGFGLMNIGAMVLLTSVAIYITLTALSKVKDLESSTHPYYRENLLHNI